MPPNLGQSNILKKLRKYVEIQEKKKVSKKRWDGVGDLRALLYYLEKGHCSGFGALYLFYKSKDNESIFFGNLRLIADWNETEKDLEESAVLQSIFEQWINDARWLQHEDKKVSKIPQENYAALFESVKPKDSKIHIEQEFEMNFVFKEKELVETLRYVIKPEKMIRLSSHNHTISIFLKDGIYHLYDSNESGYNERANSNELRTDSIETLVSWIKDDLFEGFSFNRGKVFTHLPIGINVYDFSDKEKGRYKFSSSELVAKFAKENNDINRKNDADHLTPMTFALLKGDLSVIDSLVKEGVPIPLNFEHEDKKEDTLDVAVQRNDLNFLKFIIDHNEDLIQKSNRFAIKNAIETAFRNGYYDVIEYLIERGIKNTDDLDRDIFSLHLRYSKEKGDPDLDIRVMKILKALGVNIGDFNNSYPSYASPIGWAVQTKNLTLLKYLNEQGVKLEKEQFFQLLNNKNHLASRNIVDPLTEYLIKEQFEQLKFGFYERGKIADLLLKTNPATLQLYLNAHPKVISSHRFILLALEKKDKIASDILRFLQTKMPPLEFDPSESIENQQLARIEYVERTADLEQACRVAEMREAQKEAEQQEKSDRGKNIYKASHMIEKERDRRIAENLYNKSKEGTLEPDATNKPQKP